MADEVVNGVHAHSSEDTYVYPPSPVKEKLGEFSDWKFGLFVHWGLYTQMGCLASWGLSDEDAVWGRAENEYGVTLDWDMDKNKLKDTYFDLYKTFNPILFNPDKWAELAAEAGFKYILFTTKHHDGFCMWDTKQTDYKITSPECPFSKNEKSDIVRHTFDSFRKKGIKIGAYFSKPDWHSDNFWEKDTLASVNTSRYPTYKAEEKPEKWEAFVKYTHNQLKELINDYGKIDILWLDGCWVSEKDGYDLRLSEIIAELRKVNPDLIVVDRLAKDENENYITPETTVPDRVINVPWESCMTLGYDFSYIFDDDYKSADEIFELLLDIVSKGGNLALNVSPEPNGRMPRKAIKVLKELGSYLKKYGEAIYGTRPVAPYKADNMYFTAKADFVYVITKDLMPEFIPFGEKISKIEFLNNGTETDFTQTDSGIYLKSPAETEEKFRVFKLYKA